jgi:tRNA(Ile)-lysidine synthetase-like protein
MRRLEANILRQIRQRGDGIENCSVLVACSGGGDSVALLSCLLALRKNLKIELLVAHANHGLRPESVEEAEYVKKLCKNFDVKLVSCCLDVITHASNTSQGLEMAARELRWAWLKNESQAVGASWVATGHTIEDHTETIFLRLARGSGPGCLSGLPAVQAPRWSPLVECCREDLRAYLRSLRIEWRDDQTNEQDFTPRNRWRKYLVELRDEAPSIDRHLWETHRQVADLMSLRNDTVASWRDVRWKISEANDIWLDIGWQPRDLAWVLEAAFRELNMPRDPVHIFDLARWASEVLTRPIKRKWKWGNWYLCPQTDGALLCLDAS